MWEPLVEDGREIGEVHLLVQAEGGPVAGLWRVEGAEGEAFPYRVTGSDSFHVIEGEAELETPGRREDRTRRWGHLFVPGRIHRHMAESGAVLEVLRHRLTSINAVHESVRAAVALPASGPRR